jgi:plasmid rolling circle replication initiator protein Rep
MTNSSNYSDLIQQIVTPKWKTNMDLDLQNDVMVIMDSKPSSYACSEESSGVTELHEFFTYSQKKTNTTAGFCFLCLLFEESAHKHTKHEREQIASIYS